jgi:hypothetical protein
MRTRLALTLFASMCVGGLVVAAPASAITQPSQLQPIYGQASAGHVEEVGYRRWHRRHVRRHYRHPYYYYPHAYYRPYYRPYYHSYYRPYYRPGLSFWFGF